MKKTILFLLFILILGGCGGMQNQDKTKNGSKEQTDAAALQDEFTSEFIDSTEEVEEGYLRFKSKTGGYTMLYPKDAIAYPTSYETNGNRFELLKYGTEKKDNMSFYVFATYELSKNKIDPEVSLHLLSSGNGYEGEYEKIDSNDKDIYVATDKTESKQRSIFSVMGFIQSKNSNQAVSYEYNLVCHNEQEGCSYNDNEIKDEVMKLMESITFIMPDE